MTKSQIKRIKIQKEGNERKKKYGVKLNFEKAEQIRKLYCEEHFIKGYGFIYTWNISKLAKKFNVSPRQIARILNDECWVAREKGIL